MDNNSNTIRLDQWLHKACVFKTRSKAAAACDAGHIKVNGKTAKPSKMVAAGDNLVVYKHKRYKKLKILGISHRNIEKALARKLYEEVVRILPDTTDDVLTLVKKSEKSKGRPTKRDRRRLQRLRDTSH